MTYEMYKNIAIMTAMCLLLCLSFNYTFPVHKNAEFENKSAQTNESPLSAKNIAQRTRKMAKRIGNVYKRFKESNCSKSEMSVASNDLKQYEQMVIMKKYPYLDLKDVELRYNPSSAGTRGKVNMKLATLNSIANDPSICEALDDVLNVEIINRGLSGFAIPPPEINASKLKAEVTKENRTFNEMRTAQNNLENNILKYEEVNYRM